MRWHGVTAVMIASVAAASAWIAGPARAQTFESGSTGADGAFTPTATTTVALPPSGIFHFTTVSIPAGVTVKFARNATNTPVTMLASGNVSIAGIIDVGGAAGGAGSGSASLGNNGGAGGPGGFDGGQGANGIVSNQGGAGRGPGGGGGGNIGAGGGAGFFAPGGNAAGQGIPGTGGTPYGTPSLLPFIGGSGGGGGGATLGGAWNGTGGGGGGGGGALLIASSGTITLTGSILAKGGNGGPQPAPNVGGGGSGGSVRLVATTIAGTGAISVTGGAGASGLNNTGGAGSPGRIRIEGYASTATLAFGGIPGGVVSVTQPTVLALANSPALSITAVAGLAAPAAPTASLSSPDLILPASTTNPVTVSIAGRNIPPGTEVSVSVAGQTGSGSATVVALSGTIASSTAVASLTIPTNQPSVISATATFPLAAAAAAPVFAEGEEVKWVRVTARAGEPSRVAYVTGSGRLIPLAAP
jgi:hypothetical protein